MPTRARHLDDRFDERFDEPLTFLRDCHRRIEYFLDLLLEITRSVGGRSLGPDDWERVLRAVKFFDSDEPWHIADEEQSLFPRMRASRDPAAVDAFSSLAHLERAHELANGHHRMVSVFCRRWLGHGFLSQADTRNLMDRLIELQAIYRDHIATEDREIFPAAVRLLSDRQMQDVANEMAARRSKQMGSIEAVQ